MDAITPKTFEPEFQPNKGRKVSFLLKPLDLKGQYQLQVALDEKGRPSWEGLQVAARYIVGWTGIAREDGAEVPFTRRAITEVIEGGANTDWMIWLAMIAGRLYADSLLSEIERKN